MNSTGRACGIYLEAYSVMPIPGLPLSNAWDYDNQHGMVDEPFDGNAASVMTLGGAIVRGGLAASKYGVFLFVIKMT